MQRVLVLGAGLVVRPLVQYLLDHGFGVTVASRTVSRAEALVDGHPGGEALPLLMDDEGEVERLIAAADLTISLVPPPFHPKVARMCLDLGKNLVTTSYISPQMKALDAEARDKGLLLLNEIGLDPGIDHMSAMLNIHEVQEAGGTVDEFVSTCGALPAPDSVDNPWGYKFSWSPIGVVRAIHNDGKFLRDGEVIEVPSPQLFDRPFEIEVPGVGPLEVYPNRDSLPYVELYGVEGVRTMFRGTFRYPGHSRSWSKIVALGLPDEDRRFDLRGKTLREAFALFAGVDDAAGLEQALADRFGIALDDDFFARMRFIGLLGDEPCPVEQGTPCDVFAHQLEETLVFEEGQRDMVVLRDHFEVSYPDGRREARTSLLVDYGIPGGDSATSRTVSLPAAIAARMVLEGQIELTGVQAPTAKGIYGPVLDGLAEVGIALVETVEELA